MAKKQGMTDAQKAKLKQQLMKGGNLDKPAKPGTRKITVTATSTPVKKPSNKTVQAGSMAGNSKLVLDNAAKAKAAKTYSPTPMSAAAKKKAGAAGKASMIASVKRGNDKLGIDRTLIGTTKKPKKASTAYSPKPFDTRAAAVKRSEAKRKELASKVVKAVNKTAKYTPMGVVAKGAAKAGRALGKVIPKK